jgi:hypothetical protein
MLANLPTGLNLNFVYIAQNLLPRILDQISQIADQRPQIHRAIWGTDQFICHANRPRFSL